MQTTQSCQLSPRRSVEDLTQFSVACRSLYMKGCARHRVPALQQTGLLVLQP